jgi:hypothetical protein
MEEQILEIDLEELKKNQNQLNESWLAMYGNVIEMILKEMFGMPIFGSSSYIKGKPQDIRDFAKAVGNEKKYVQMAKEYGLNDPKTYKQRGKLQKAIQGFEKGTGIKWPFK